MPAAVALRALGLGDFVTGLPALRLLRENLPGHRLVLAAPAVFEPLLPLGVPVDELWPTAELAPIACAGQVDLGFDLHGNGPASRRLLDATGAPRVYGFGYPGRAGPRWRPEEHEVQRWQRLVCESLQLTGHTTEVRLAVPAVDVVEGVTVVHPGAAYASRRWPAERFRTVIGGLRERGHQVVLSGGSTERLEIEKMARMVGVPPLTGLSLLELFALIAHARLVICGDTGVAHVASLYRRPSVLLFGPVAPARWGPPADGPHLVLWHGDGTGDPHGHEPDPALLRIQPAEVLRAVDQLARGSHRLPSRGKEATG